MRGEEKKEAKSFRRDPSTIWPLKKNLLAGTVGRCSVSPCPPLLIDVAADSSHITQRCTRRPVNLATFITLSFGIIRPRDGLAGVNDAFRRVAAAATAPPGTRRFMPRQGRRGAGQVSGQKGATLIRYKYCGGGAGCGGSPGNNTSVSKWKASPRDIHVIIRN